MLNVYTIDNPNVRDVDVCFRDGLVQFKYCMCSPFVGGQLVQYFCFILDLDRGVCEGRTWRFCCHLCIYMF